MTETEESKPGADSGEDNEFQKDFHAFLHAQATLVAERRLEARAIVRGLIWVGAFVLGIRGFDQLNVPDNNLYGYVENFYRTLQLLTVHMPHEYPKNLPLELQIARFALPICTLWFAVGTFFDYAIQPLRAFSIIRMRNHLVICGETPRSRSIARQASKAGYKVVQVVDDQDDVKSLLRERLTPLVGSVESSGVLFRAGVGKAQALVVATGNVIINVGIAIRAVEVAAKHRGAKLKPLEIIVECDDPDMAAVLDGSFAQIASNVELTILSPAETTARSILPRLIPTMGTREHSGSLLMIGAGTDSEAVLLRILRNAPQGFNVALAADAAPLWLERLSKRFPEMPSFASAVAFDIKTGRDMFDHGGLRAWLLDHAPCVMVIHGAREEEELAAAIAARRFLRDAGLPAGPILARDTGSGPVLDALALMDNDSADLSRIWRFGSTDDVCTPDVVLRGDLDAMARAVHDNYRSAGTGADSAQPWETLRETYREASRSQADHLDVKLAAIHCRRVRQAGVVPDFVFTAAEIERLALLEHERWCADRWLDGWRYGPVKDAVLKTHPSLAPYDQLSEDVKDLDRQAVAHVPAIAAAVGFAVLRQKRLLESGDGFGPEAETAKQEGFDPVAVIPVWDEAGIVAAEKRAAAGHSFILAMLVGVHLSLQPGERRRLNAVLGKADRVLWGRDGAEVMAVAQQNCDAITESLIGC